MKFSLRSSDILSSSANKAVLLRFEKGVKENILKKADRKLEGHLVEKIDRAGFSGEFGTTLSIDTVKNYKFREIVVIGLGKKEDFGPLRAFRLGNIVAKNIKLSSPTVSIDYGNIPPAYLGLIIEGIIVGCYSYEKFKSSKTDTSKVEEIIVHSKKISTSSFSSKVEYAKNVSSSIALSRDLVNDPPNSLTPEALANHASKIAENSGFLECRIYDENELADMGMNALRAVSLGSDNPPRFIHMTYKPENRTTRQIAIVGKGITFDSGGLCIKPADGMKTMKMDMAGAAVVLGVMKAISELKPKVVVHGLIPASENMTGGLAYKPDDVIKVLNGKTVEIVNTDAEGRVAMSDALSYAVKNNVSEIIDLATLTGACIVGLGPYTAGVMGNNSRFIKSLLKSAENTGEKMWQLPLDEELSDEIKSQVADIKNSGSRWGGAITAGLFLQNFVDDTPWTHIDIAGPSFIEKPNDWYPYGATGFGVKTIVDYLLTK